MSGEVVKVVEFRIRRYNAERKESFVSVYKVPVSRGTTILDALIYIRDNLDGTLTFRHSCRMGICGSCGVNVNGKPMLACHTQVLDLRVDVLTIEPLSNLPVIKDLVVDFQPFFLKFKKIKPVLIRPKDELEKAEEFLQTPQELKKYWDLTLCTKCSICYSACPITIDERFLGPSALATNYRFIVDTRDKGMEKRIKATADSIWLCTSCGSCTLFCPKEVDASSSIIEERGLTVEGGYIPRTVTDVLTNVMRYHNPMGRYPTKRQEWTQGLNVRTYPNVIKANILYFVCCLTAYDTRCQEIARSFATILNRLSVDFATLGNEEWCCGDHVLRMGERGLFEMLAEHNVSMFRKFNAERIVTLSPHCYNTFKNDMPYCEANLNVQHYTQFLAEALSSNRLKLSKPIKRRVAYHDPCFLSKRNRIYDEPRQILQSINGIELIEMRRNRENSFCCGGGAGRLWTEEAQPEKRPSVSRIKEALELGVDTIAVSCPFCVAMLEDAAKVLDVENKISIKDISELVVEAL
jgi:succinate dehydrogenase/fumarate reductase iron-sulfur protein